MKRRIIYIDMDDVLCDYATAHQKMLIENPTVKYPQSQAGFFQGLMPIDKAIESIKMLHDCDLFELYILTAPSIRNPLCYTEKRLWIEEHLGFEMVNRLIISSNKGLNKGHYLIDDYIEGRGQENFEGKLIQFASNDFPDWRAVITYFKKQFLDSIS